MLCKAFPLKKLLKYVNFSMLVKSSLMFTAASNESKNGFHSKASPSNVFKTNLGSLTPVLMRQEEFDNVSSCCFSKNVLSFS